MSNAATQHHPLRTAAAALREEIRSGDSAPGLESAALPDAGWYSDPENPDGWRYWNGKAWTEHHHCEVPPRKQEVGALAILGYLAAVVVPVLGIVVAIPLLVRGESRHAGGVLLTVVVSFVIRMAILSNGGY